MTLKYVLVLIVIVLTSGLAYAQDPGIVWEKSYGMGDKDEWVAEMIQTNDGNFVMGGVELSEDLLQSKVFFLEIDMHGNVIRDLRIELPLLYDVASIKQTSDNGFIILSTVNSEGVAGNNFNLMKLDRAGNIQWINTYYDEYNARGVEIIQLQNGYYMIIGDTEINDSLKFITYARIDANGNIEFTHYFEETQLIYNPANGYLDYNGNIVITGYAVEIIDDMNSVVFPFLLKINADAIIYFIEIYKENDYNGFGDAVISTNDGGYMITGSRYSTATTESDEDLFLLKTNAIGQMEWRKKISQSYSIDSDALQQTSDNGYIVIGFAYDGLSDQSTDNVYLNKSDANGNLLWEKILTRPKNQITLGIFELADGSYIFGGCQGQGETSSTWDAFAMRTQPDPLGIENLQVDKSDFEFRLNKNSENTFYIKYSIQLPGNVNLQLFDVQGRIIKQLEDSYKQAGEYGMEFNNEGITKGIYFVKLNHRKKIYTRKLIMFQGN